MIATTTTSMMTRKICVFAGEFAFSRLSFSFFLLTRLKISIKTYSACSRSLLLLLHEESRTSPCNKANVFWWFNEAGVLLFNRIHCQRYDSLFQSFGLHVLRSSLEYKASTSSSFFLRASLSPFIGRKTAKAKPFEMQITRNLWIFHFFLCQFTHFNDLLQRSTVSFTSSIPMSSRQTSLASLSYIWTRVLDRRL